MNHGFTCIHTGCNMNIGWKAVIEPTPVPLIVLPEPKGTEEVKNRKKILQKVLAGSKNIRFSDMMSLARGFGFRLSRTEGSHNIFVHPDIPELVNLQEVKGQAKPYQIRQFLKLVERYSLKLEED